MVTEDFNQMYLELKRKIEPFSAINDYLTIKYPVAQARKTLTEKGITKMPPKQLGQKGAKLLSYIFENEKKMESHINPSPIKLESFTDRLKSGQLTCESDEIKSLEACFAKWSLPVRVHVCSDFPHSDDETSSESKHYLNASELPVDVVYLKCLEKKSDACFIGLRLHHVEGMQKLRVDEHIYDELLANVNQPEQKFRLKTARDLFTLLEPYLPKSSITGNEQDLSQLFENIKSKFPVLDQLNNRYILVEFNQDDIECLQKLLPEQFSKIKAIDYTNETYRTLGFSEKEIQELLAALEDDNLSSKDAQRALVLKQLIQKRSASAADILRAREQERKLPIVGSRKINVPSDGYCLYWAAALGLLTSKIFDETQFKDMFVRLFGDDTTHLELVKFELLRVCRFGEFSVSHHSSLLELIKQKFCPRVTEHMGKNFDEERKIAIYKGANCNSWNNYVDTIKNATMWGGEAEIITIEAMADVKIVLENYSEFTSQSSSNDILHLALVHGNHFQFYLPFFEEKEQQALLTKSALNINNLELHFDHELLNEHLGLLACDDTNNLKQEVLKIESAGKSVSSLLEELPPINEWQLEHVQQWVQAFRHKISQGSTTKLEGLLKYELLAVLDRANYIATYEASYLQSPSNPEGHHLKDTQLLSLLLLLNPQTDHGRLLQVKTGEGKSTIVAMFAAINVLLGKGPIDVVTSSPVLAKRDAQTKQRFYELLGMNASHNNQDPDYIRGAKNCYKADIVYGSVSDFQFDILRHEYSDLETRGIRQFGTVIVDEVDSMLLDQGGNIAKLSQQQPGMEFLESYYLQICLALDAHENELDDAAKKLIQQLREIDEANDIELLESLLLEQGIFKTREELFEKLYRQVIEAMDANTPMIPIHLKSYAHEQAKKWVRNAIRARYEMQPDVDYRLMEEIDEKTGEKKNIIAPLDYSNTGITLNNTVWSDGLHQFLQYKHRVQMTPENYTTAFISNSSFFKRYGSKLFGLTGTLGAEAEKKLLQDHYKVDTQVVPPYIQSKCIAEPWILESSEEDWLTTILEQLKKEIDQGRSALVLCKSRAEALKVEEFIKDHLEHFSGLKTYLNEHDDTPISKELKPGEIIISTNLAGRGTDIPTSDELDAQGGLSVIGTFLPDNLRVEEQAFGRTARQGKPGRTRLILNEQNTLRDFDIDEQEYTLECQVLRSDVERIEWLKLKRNEREESRIMHIRQDEVPLLAVQDQLFECYQQLCQRLREKARKENRDGTFAIMLRALEDQWGLWLQNPECLKLVNEITINYKSECLDKPEHAKENLSKRVHNLFYSGYNSDEENLKPQALRFDKNFELAFGDKLEDIILNPSYYTHLGHYYYEVGNYDSARKMYEQSNAQWGAHDISFINDYYLAFLEIETAKVTERKIVEELKSSPLAPFAFLYEQMGGNASSDYMEKARRHLLNAEKKLEQLLAQFKNEIEQCSCEESNDFLNGLQDRFILYKYYYDGVKSHYKFLNQGSYDETIRTHFEAIVRSRMPLMERDQLKDTGLTTRTQTLNEVNGLGLNHLYQLRTLSGISPGVRAMAYAQISIGASMLPYIAAFPIASPVLQAAASIAISEGVSDLVMELITDREQSLDVKDTEYWSGKAISYGIGLVTLGLGAIASIFRKAANLCQRLAGKLSAVKGFWSKIATPLAKFVNRIEKGLHKVASNLRWQRMGTGKAIKSIGREVGMDIGMQLFTEKVLNVLWESILNENVKPVLQKAILKEFQKSEHKLFVDHLTQLLCVPNGSDDVRKHIKEALDEDIQQILIRIGREIGLGMLRHGGTRSLKLLSLGLDALFLSQQTNVADSVNQFIENFKEKCPNTAESSAEKQDANSKGLCDSILTEICDQLAEKATNQIRAFASKGTNTFLVQPTISKVARSFNSRQKENGVPAGDKPTGTRENESVRARPLTMEQQARKTKRNAALSEHNLKKNMTIFNKKFPPGTHSHHPDNKATGYEYASGLRFTDQIPLRRTRSENFFKPMDDQPQQSHGGRRRANSNCPQTQPHFTEHQQRFQNLIHDAYSRKYANQVDVVVMRDNNIIIHIPFQEVLKNPSLEPYASGRAQKSKNGKFKAYHDGEIKALSVINNLINTKQINENDCISIIGPTAPCFDCSHNVHKYAKDKNIKIDLIFTGPLAVFNARPENEQGLSRSYGTDKAKVVKAPCRGLYHKVSVGKNCQYPTPQSEDELSQAKRGRPVSEKEFRATAGVLGNPPCNFPDTPPPSSP